MKFYTQYQQNKINKIKLIYSYVSFKLILVLFVISNFELTHFLIHKFEDLGQNNSKTLHIHLDSNVHNDSKIQCASPNKLNIESKFDKNSISFLTNTLLSNPVKHKSCFAHNQTHYNYTEIIDTEIEVKLNECLLHTLNLNLSSLIDYISSKFEIFTQLSAFYSRDIVIKSFLDFVSLSNKAPPTLFNF